MHRYIYQFPDWPTFSWDRSRLVPLLTKVNNDRVILFGNMEILGFSLQDEATLQTLTLDVVKSSEIEGEILNYKEVRSSIARKLNIVDVGVLKSDKNIDGVVELMLDATQNYHQPLTKERLFKWHLKLFPNGVSGNYKIVSGNWRDNAKEDPMQIVSGNLQKPLVHFQAPNSDIIDAEMDRFLYWINTFDRINPLLKAAIAHLWFIIIHPFEDGNGRIARAITDMLLARADGTSHRFYSMSAQIRMERKSYYEILEKTQSGTLDITSWIEWFFNCLARSVVASEIILSKIIIKAKFWRKYSGFAFNSRQELMLNKILDGFDGKLTSSKWQKITKCSQDTAGRDISDLIQKNILERETAGGRSTNYVLKIFSV